MRLAQGAAGDNDMVTHLHQPRGARVDDDSDPVCATDQWEPLHDGLTPAAAKPSL
jgi:hypothetical protein